MTDPTVQEISEADIRISVRPFPGCRREVDATVGKEILEEARKEAIKAVRKEVSLPGFRKGKAPDVVLLKKFSSQIQNEEKQRLADLAFNRIRALTSLEILSSGPVSYNVKEKTETEAILSFSFEVEPEVSTSDIGRFTSSLPAASTPTEEQINETLEQMRFYHAGWKLREDRPVQEGDYLTLDLETENEQGVYQKVFDKVRFEVSKKRMADWMKEAVLNAKMGDVVESTSKPDENASEEEKKNFPPKKVRLTIHTIEEADLPPLDDAFAQKVGSPNLEELRKNITSLLEFQLKESHRDKLREEVNQFLISKSSFELPHSQVEGEKKYRIQQAMANSAFQKKWGQMSREEQEEWERKTTQEAKEALSLFYIARQLVRDAKIPITQKELQDEIVQVFEARGEKDLKALSSPPPEVRALALSRLVLRKAQDFLLG